MKKLFVIALLCSGGAFAQSVELVSTNDGDIWYGYPSTFKQEKDRISLQVGYKPNGKEESMMFVSISPDTCITRRGSLYAKDSDNRWSKMATVQIPNVTSVADHLALVMCSVSAQEKQKKPKLTV